MEATEPVSMDETMEILDDQNYALESTSPDDGRLTQAKGVPSLAMPVGSRAESVNVDSLSSSSYAEDWLKIAQINQENMIGAASYFDGMADNMDAALIGAASLKGLQDQIMGAALPEALGVSGYVSDLAASMDTALVGAAGLKGLQDQIIGAAIPEALGVSGYVSDLAASMDTALVGATGLKGLQDQIMGAALPEALGVSGYVSDLAASMDTALVGATGLKGLQDQIMGAAIPEALGVSGYVSDLAVSMDTALVGAAGLKGLQDQIISAALPEALGVSGYVSDLAASMDTALVGAASLKGLQDQIMGAAIPDALGMASFIPSLAAGVNTTLAWAEILQEHRKELFRIDERMMRHVEPLLESLKPITGLYLNDDECFATCCMRLGQRGWFLDPQMPMSLLWHLADTIEESPEEADELLMQWFRERLDEIEEELVKTCPRRARVLRSAFNAHRERDYNNSVPAFLKEADGVWHDLFGMNVFIAKDRKSIVKSIEQKQPYGLVWTSLGPLLQSTLPLWMNEIERQDWMKRHRTDSFPGLNRHVVVHGISVDYGTETNSLKAISFLNWRLVVELVVREPL